jgi:hypothetical protein
MINCALAPSKSSPAPEWSDLHYTTLGAKSQWVAFPRVHLFPGAVWLVIARHPHHERSLCGRRAKLKPLDAQTAKVRLGSVQATDSLNANVAEQALCGP